MKKNSAEFAVLDCVEVPKTKIFRGCAPGPRGGLTASPKPPSCFSEGTACLRYTAIRAHTYPAGHFGFWRP